MHIFRHNIGYGDLSAKEEDVIKAAELAELHDSILDWPKGYDTQVGVNVQLTPYNPE